MGVFDWLLGKPDLLEEGDHVKHVEEMASANQMTESQMNELLDSSPEGVEYKKALQTVKNQAESGNASACLILGQLNLYHKDYEECVFWFRKGAELGNVDSQYEFGECLMNGRGVAINKYQAHYWFLQAANQGCSTSQFLLGIHYSIGKGVRQDNVQAYKWFSLAIESASPNSDLGKRLSYEGSRVLDDLASRMTAIEIAQAKREIHDGSK